ncbi:MAG: fumarylacetoacetate hydrolase family protein [Pseudomonadota bacterium]
MRLVRYRAPNQQKGTERPAILDPEDNLRDLSNIIPDLAGAALSPDSLANIRALDLAALPIVGGNPELGPCVGDVGKFICVGLNYADHAREAGLEPPREPVLFAKATSSISGPSDPIRKPAASTKLDWEVELAAVIGSACREIDEADALAHVAGYCIVNDVSERAFQIEREGQWIKGKSADTFGPVGPWLVTSDDMSDLQDLNLWLDVNGEACQRGNTSTMIFSVATCIAYVSQFMSLQPGDIVSTGTPPGVGLGMKPPRFLEVGDVVSLGIEGLGEQRQVVVAP